MARKPFDSLLENKRASRIRRTSADELEESSAPEFQTEVEPKAEIPEDATKLDGVEVYLTSDGDINIVLGEEGLTLEGFDEPIHLIEVQVHADEEAAPAVPEEPQAEDLHTETPVEDAPAEEEEAEMTAEAVTALNSLDQDNAVVAFIQAGNETNPMWVVTKNGMPFATIAFCDQDSKDEEFRKVFASDLLTRKVSHTASEIGWSKVLPYMKAKLITDKGLVAVSEPVNIETIKAQAKTELFNDMQLAYSLMQASVRENPLAGRLREAIVASGMEQPELFVAGVMNDPSGSFVSALVDTAREISNMSEQTKDEYKVLASRASVAVPAPVTYTPDHNFMARLAQSSVASNAPVAPVSGRFAGLFTR